MWRDILIIFAFLLAAFNYFGLTPRQISRYAGIAKGKITRRHPFQITYLALATSLSLFTIIAFVYKYQDWHTEIWSYICFFIILNDVLWVIAIGLWKLPSKVNKIYYIVAISIALLSFAGYNILVDTPLWVKISPITGGAVGWLAGRIESRIKKRAS